MAEKKGQKKGQKEVTPAKAGRTLKGGVRKAWKQGKPPEERTPKKRERTPERVVKDEMIRARREARKAELARRKAEEEAEAALALEPTPVGVAVRTKRLKAGKK